MTPSSTPASPSGVEYKDTLNLPQTTFKMKAGAAAREPEIEALWEELDVYNRAQASRDKSRKFILHDGPPYLSSDKIHIGTALNKVLKDIITRYKFQRGYYAPYVPGYDGHGLPIENAVVKSVKGGRSAITPLELRKRCREFAAKNLQGQEANFKRLGVWGDWAHPYLSIDAAFEATQVKLFAQMYEKGFAYKGLKPVYWCSDCETALADAEVDYADHTSDSIYVRFAFDDDSLTPQQALLSGAKAVIWTTTPWTLPANLALAVNASFLYVVIETEDGERLLLAKDRLDAFAQDVGLESWKICGEMDGQGLEFARARHPFMDRLAPVLCGSHVTLDAGTGVVHTAPGHGMEDYALCHDYNRKAFRDNPLPILSPLNNRGVFTEEGGERLAGMRYDKANAKVLELLRETGALLGHTPYLHSYPHCWRCHEPVIYRATEQWFIAVDKFREDALQAIRGVTWIPARGEARIASMVESRSDWCISRQRVWGVPIPVFYDDATGEILINQAIIAQLYTLFSQHTTDIWWEWTPEQLLEGLSDNDKAAIGLGKRTLRKEMDIMDVWFDSGVTHTAVVEARHEQLGHLPVELYLEGSDQHRGWFQSSLLTSVMLHGMAPYQRVLTHGFVLDGQGRKMSKSLGNVIDPNALIAQHGADVLRLWVASVDYSVDVRLGQETVQQLVEVYKKIRNTVRYMISNLYDFDPAQHTVAPEALAPLDRYILHRLQEVVSAVGESFDQYEFHRYYQALQNFCVVELSALYFDVCKDVLYCDPANSPQRRAIQTTLMTLMKTLIPMLAPVTPHLADDIWLNLPPAQQAAFTPGETPPPSVTMLPWPEVRMDAMDYGVKDAFNAFFSVKDVVNLALDAARARGDIKSSLEARVEICVSEGADLILKPLGELALPPLLLVSDARIVETPSDEADLLERQERSEIRLFGEESRRIVIQASVYRAVGSKCARCWHFCPSVGEIEGHATICQRCHEAVNA
ncbi:MAG: isoleucine--tRNA ligase [Vampirovibrionales bacterium]|nr:isoleucine--tRNA ligase [Vampirovibrionales bacterium]